MTKICFRADLLLLNSSVGRAAGMVYTCYAKSREYDFQCSPHI